MKRRMLELNQLKDNTKIVLGGFEMKEKSNGISYGCSNSNFIDGRIFKRKCSNRS